MERDLKQILSGVGFYATLAICLTIVGVCGYYLLFDKSDTQPAAAEIPEPQQTVTAPAPEIAEAPKPAVVETVKPEPVPVQEPAPEPMPEAEVDPTPVIAEAPRLIVEPLRGDVVAAFSMDKLLYSETLADWRTHDGVDIAAKPGTTVLAACSGTVYSVTDDVLMGTTVVLEHSGGYRTTYANLQETPPVEIGDTVTAGQIIGTVGITAAAEAAQAPHLHFSVTKDGAIVDPNEFLEG